MTKTSQMKGATKLTVDGVVAITDLVEYIHHTINTFGLLFDGSGNRRTSGLTGLVYRNIRTVTHLAGWCLDRTLNQLGPLLERYGEGDWERTTRNQALRAALNGLIGDYLAAQKNPLALPMELHWKGGVIDLDAPSFKHPLTQALKSSDGELLLLIHGSCMSAQAWCRGGHDHGAALVKEKGIPPLYLQYNSGLHISQNGRALAALLERLSSWVGRPLRLKILSHSMGGLVARSACHYAKREGYRWLKGLDKLVFLGTPHHGAPMERGGKWIDVLLKLHPYSAPFARLTEVRSAGINDLRYGNLLDTDWKGEDGASVSMDPREAVPLPVGVDCYAAAAVAPQGALKRATLSPGDGLVPLDSALGRHPLPARRLSFPPDQQWIGEGLSHMGLLSDLKVYDVIKGWLDSSL